MACNTTFTTNSFLSDLGIYDTSCSKKISFMNRVLRVFYSRTFELHDNMVTHSIAIPKGESTYTLTYPLYKLHGLYGRGQGNMFVDRFSMTDYHCEGETVKRIKFEKGVHFLDDRQRKKDLLCDDKIILRSPCDIVNGNIVYSRGHSPVTTVTGNITMTDYLRTGFELLAEEMRSSQITELNNTSYRNSQFERRLENAKAIDAEAPEFITIG